VQHQPPGAVTADVDARHDAVANFAHIRLDGDFYNGLRGSATSARNLVLNLDAVTVRGVLSASTTVTP
jgi:hypothetical protein